MNYEDDPMKTDDGRDVVSKKVTPHSPSVENQCTNLVHHFKENSITCDCGLKFPRKSPVEESREVNGWEYNCKCMNLDGKCPNKHIKQDWRDRWSAFNHLGSLNKIKEFIESELTLARREVLRDVLKMSFEELGSGEIVDSGYIKKSDVETYAKENNINLTEEGKV